MLANLPLIIFCFIGTCLIVSAMLVVAFRNVFHAALALTATLGLVAGIYVLLGADFLAVSQILVYVGGVMVLILFAVMYAQQSPLEKPAPSARYRWIGALLSLGLGTVLSKTSWTFGSQSVVVPAPLATTAPLGRLLLGELLVAFELVSLVLLAAAIGAIHFCNRPRTRA